MHGAGPVALVPSTFNADTLAYAASVGHAVTTVTVVPETGAGGAVVTYLDGAGAVLADADGEAEHFQLALSEGENTVQVKVTATVPTSMRTYVLTVTRRALSIDATLESLALANASDAVLDLAPPFNPGVTAYAASVGYEVDQVTVAAGMGYPDATVQFLDGTDAALADANAAPGFQAALAVGANTVKVKVTAEDGKATETYVLTVTRATAGTLPLTVEEGIAGDDVVNAVEKAAGFVIAGTTGTVAGASVTVRVGTEELTSVSGADGAWSVSVPPVAVYIADPGVEVTVSAMQGDYTDAEAVTRTLGVDLTAPQVVSSTVHGTSLAMVYTEPLDTSSVPEADAFVVKVDGSQVALAEAGAVTFDGASLTLTLAAAANTGQAVTVTYTTPTGQDAAPLRDAAGNEVVSDTVERMVDVRDSTAPTVASIARRSPTSSPTNADELIWRVTFSEGVANVDAGDFEVSGTAAALTVAAVSGSPLAYDVTAAGGGLAGLTGTVTLSFSSGQDIADTDGNVLENTEPTDANDASYVLDNTAPTVEISGVPDTSTGVFTAVIAFSEVVNGFAVEDIAVVNGSAAALAGTYDGKKFTALITPRGDGTVTVDVAAGVAEDTAGNGNLVAARASSAYIAPLTDNNAPTVVSITRQTPLSSPTNANTLTWRVIFSEDVVNVDGADFRVSGTTATLMAGAVSGSSLAYDVTAAGSGLASVDATVTLSFAAEQNITDRDGDALSNTAPTGANDVTFVVDNNAPGVTSVARQTPSSSPTNADRLTWRVTFSEAVANVDGADFRVTGTTAALTVAPVVSETGAYDVTAAAGNLASVDATVTLSFAAVQDIADTAGNALASTVPTKVSEASYVVDNTAPGVRSITRQTPTESPTNADELTWRVTFSEAVANVDAADFRVAGTTAALTVAPVVSETGAYDVTAAADNLASVDATVTLSFAAVQNIADTVGNALASTVPTKVSEASYVVDNTAPGVEITRVPAESEAAFTAMITFLEGVTGFAVEDITVGNGTASNFTGADGGTVFSVLITPTEDGEVTVEVAAEVATDAAGNGNTAAAQVSSTYTGFDPTAGICGRTEAVRDAIVAGIDDISDCADVTPIHLEAIKVLTLRNARVTALAAGDFAGLTALITLDLSGNRLTALPAGVFDGLTSLTTLRLYSNRLATLRSDVFAGLTNLSILNLDFNDLQTLPAGVFGGLKKLNILKLNDNPGAPFAPTAVAVPDDGTVPAAGGTVTLDGSGGGGPWGGNVTYSWALTTPSSGVTVSFDDRRRGTPKVTIPAVAAGTELTFTLTVTGRGGANPFSNGFDTSQDTATVTVSQPGICTRTAAVQTAILGKIEGVDDCADVTATHLAAITGSLSLSRRSISSIAAGDFAGLTALTALYLHRNSVSELPVGVFDDLTSLTTLNLQGNNLSTIPARTFARLTSLTHLHLSNNGLSTLPAGVFDGLTALTNLTLYGNSLTALPARVFDGLTALNSLDLWGNSLGTLPAGVFDDLTSLTTLLLYSNSLGTLPAGVFEPLERLTELRLDLNPGAPFEPTAVALPDDGTVPVAGGTVRLDGSGSGGAWGENVNYSWELIAPANGVEVTFADDNDNRSITPMVTIPPLAAGTELTFRLTVTGRAANTRKGARPGRDTATVTAVPVDTIAPTVMSIVRQSPASSPTNADILTWRVTFSEDVANVDAADFEVSDTAATLTVAAVPGSLLAYDVTAVEGGLADLTGTVTLSFASGHNIVDTARNALANTEPTEADEPSYVLDNAAPAVMSIVRHSPATSPTNADSLTWRVTFSEDVANVDAADFEVSGTAATLTVAAVPGSRLAHDVTAAGGGLDSLEATVTLSFASGHNIADTVGNALTSTALTGANDVTFVLDRTAPTMASVARHTPSSSPTNADRLTWRVTYSEAVTNVDATEFAVSDRTATLEVSAVSGVTFDVTASGGNLGNLDGTVTLAFAAASTIQDVAGNVLDGSTPPATNEVSYVVDNIAPRVASILRQTPASSPTNADVLIWRVTFGEEVANVDAADFEVSGASAALTVAAVSGSPLAYDVTATGGGLASLEATVTLSFASDHNIADTLGNALANTQPTGANEPSYVVDNTAPAVMSILRQTPASSPTNADVLIWRVTFGEDVANVDGADFEVSGTAATLTATPVGSETGAYDVTAAGGGLASLTGTVTLSFSSDHNIADTAGNALVDILPTGTNETSYAVDHTAPTAEISGVPDTSSGAFTATITFTEGVKGFAVEDIAVGNGTASAFTGSEGGREFTALITPTGTGTITVDVAEGVAEDAVGNGNLAAARVSSSYVALLTGTTAPTVLSITRQIPLSSPTNANRLTWRVIFSEDVVNVDGADFAVSDRTATLTVVAVSRSSLAYDVTAAGGGLASLETTVTLSFAADQNITDTDGNALANTAPTGANDATFVLDRTAPTMASVERHTPSSSPTNADRLTWRVTFSEAVANVDAADFAVSDRTATLEVSVVSGVTGAFDVTASGGNLGNLDGTVTLTFATPSTIRDVAGNVLDRSTPPVTNEVSYVVDNIAPTVTITGVPDISTGAFTATITFTEGVRGFAVEDIAVGNGTASAFTGSAGGREFTALITPTENGTVTVDVAEGVAEDALGNGNLAAARVSSTFDPNAGICGRTAAVRDTILAAIAGVGDCALVTGEHLAAITGELNLAAKSITALAAGDFAGLTALTGLDLNSNALATLPAGVFDSLTKLTVLNLRNNTLTTLPAAVFARLAALETLFLNNNTLATLPAGVFAGLTSLTELRLATNPGAPFAPVAVALPDDGTVPVAGGTVPLDGSGSDGGPWGANVEYSWALTTPANGVTVPFDDDESARPMATIPAQAAGTELTFTLTVTGRGSAHASSTGVDSGTDTAKVTATATDANAAPVFTSAAAFNAAENQTAVGTVQASDGNGEDSVTGYAITGGADRLKFSIGTATGVLAFNAPQNFEDATDADGNNAYVVVVRATSGADAREKTAEQTITVTVTDVDGEAPGVPAVPTVSSAGVTSVTVSWVPPVNTGPPITDYDYQYRVKTTAGAWTEVTETTITAPPATITTLVENTEYEVQVRATNDEGTSGWSGSGNGTTDANAGAGVHLGGGVRRGGEPDRGGDGAGVGRRRRRQCDGLRDRRAARTCRSSRSSPRPACWRSMRRRTSRTRRTRTVTTPTWWWCGRRAARMRGRRRRSRRSR